MVVFFRMVHNDKLFKDPVISIGPFQKVQHKVIFFPYVARKKEKLPSIVQNL